MIRSAHGSRAAHVALAVALAASWCTVCLVGGSSVASAQATGSVEINQVLWDKYPVISLFVTVRNANGRPVLDLDSEAFTVTEDGEEIPSDSLELSTVETERTPIHIALALDVSGSMKGDKLADAKAAATEFIGSLTPRDRLALYRFSDEPELVQDFTNNQDVLRDQVARLEADGNTALTDTVFSVARKVGEVEGRRAVIVFTDGQQEPPFASTQERDERTLGAVTAATESEAPVYTLGFGGDIDEEILATFAHETGGAFLSAPSDGEIGSLFDEVAGLLESQYIVTYPTTIQYDPDNPEHVVGVSVEAPDVQAEDEYKAAVLDTSLVLPPESTPSPTPTPPCANPPCDEGGMPMWLPIVALLAGLALLGLILWLVRTKRTRRCPVCGRTMDPNWAECLFCHPPSPTPSPDPDPDPTPDPTRQPEPLRDPKPEPRRDKETVIIRPGEGKSMAFLMGVDGPERDRQYRLDLKETSVGRSADSDIRIDDPYTSRHHAKIKHDDGEFVIHDLASSGGTFVNDQRLERKHVLADGDRIRIGQNTFVFKRVS